MATKCFDNFVGSGLKPKWEIGSHTGHADVLLLLLQTGAASALIMATAVPSRQCSLYVPGITLEKEYEMKILYLGIFALGSALAPSASATTPPDLFEGHAKTPVVIDRVIEKGFRISDQGDFQIVEHGHWSPPESALLPQFSASNAVLFARRASTTKKTIKIDSNFRRATFLRDVHAAEARFGLPHGLLDALIWAESRYNPSAVSSAGAAGLGQLMIGTAKDLGMHNRFDPQANIHGAARYLRQMLDRFGMVHLAVAAYNAGPGAVGRAKGIPLNRETPSYVRSVLERWRSI